MAKFCNKCGKELVNGKCPECTNNEEEIKEEEVAEEAAINMEDVKNTVKNLKDSPVVQKIIGFYKGAVVSPIKLAKSEDNTSKFNWLMCLLNSVVIGIITIIFCNIGLSKIMGSLQGLERTLLGGYANSSNYDLNLPYFKILVFIVAMSIISNIIIFILEKIFFGTFGRNKAKMSKYFAVQTVLYTIFTLAFVASVISSFISLKVCFIIFILGLVMDVVVLVQLLLSKKSTNKNVLAIITPIYVVISIIAVIFVWIIGLSTIMYGYNSSSVTIMNSSTSGYNNFNW